MRFITLAFFLVTSINALALQQTVIVSTNSKTDIQVMSEAKNKALLLSLDKLPAIVWGEESLQDDVYSEHLQSVGYAHAVVTPLQETFDRSARTYTLVAEVDFDKAAIMHTLDQVAKGRMAQSTLDQLNALISQQNIQRYINMSGQGVPPQIEAALFSNPHFYAQSYEELIAAHENLIAQFAGVVTQQLKAKMKQFQFVLSDVTKDHFTFRFTGPGVHQPLEFISPELEKIYLDYQKEIHEKAGDICLMDSFSRALYKAPESFYASANAQLPMDKEFHFTSASFSSEAQDALFVQKRPLFDIVFCDRVAFNKAYYLKDDTHPAYVARMRH